MKLISKKTLLLFFLPGAIFMGAFLIYPIFKWLFDSFFKVGILQEPELLLDLIIILKHLQLAVFEAAEKYIDLYFDCGICGNSFRIYFCIII